MFEAKATSVLSNNENADVSQHWTNECRAIDDIDTLRRSAVQLEELIESAKLQMGDCKLMEVANVCLYVSQLGLELFRRVTN